MKRPRVASGAVPGIFENCAGRAFNRPSIAETQAPWQQRLAAGARSDATILVLSPKRLKAAQRARAAIAVLARTAPNAALARRYEALERALIDAVLADDARASCGRRAP
jgi:hypothetical protein